MSEANQNIDYEAQSLLVFSSDSSPRYIWTRIIVLLHSISKFKAEAESSYTCIDEPNAEVSPIQNSASSGFTLYNFKY